MEIFYYISLLLAQAGNTAKQYAMKVCGRRTPGAFNSICINMARAAVCLIVSAVIWLVTDGKTTSEFGHFMIIVAGIGTAFNLFTWILSSSLVSLMLIESVSMLGTLVLPLLLAPYLYDGDTVSVMQWMGCVLVFVSMFMFMSKDEGKKKQCGLLTKIVIVGICAISTTVASIFKKYYTFHITDKGIGSIEYFAFISFVTVMAVFLLLFAVFYRKERQENGKKVELPYKKVWLYIVIAAVCLYVNELFTTYASQLPSAVFYPLSKGLLVIATFLLDVIAFKDKVTVKKIIGLVIVLIAIVLINI